MKIRGKRVMNKNHIVLTAAGFTKNFGAPLAVEFKNLVLAKIKNVPALLKELNDNSNFEDAYVSVMKGNFSEEEKKRMHQALVDSFNNDLNKSYENRNYGQSIYAVPDHLILPLCKGKQFGTLFTLNQDLFMERKIFHNAFQFTPVIPGVRYAMNLPSEQEQNVNIDEASIELFQESLEALHRKKGTGSNLLYIKLHGSTNWFDLSSSLETLIIGVDKEKIINKTPLLLCYFNFFKESVFRENTKLLIIGYGFGDHHINSVLKRAQESHGLEIHLMYPNNNVEEKVRNVGLMWQGFYNLTESFFCEKTFSGNSELTRFKKEFFDQ